MERLDASCRGIRYQGGFVRALSFVPATVKSQPGNMTRCARDARAPPARRSRRTPDRWRHSVANPLEKLLRAGEGRILRRLEQVVKAVNALEDEYGKLTDDELRGETEVLRARYEKGEDLDRLMPEAFAAVREAAKRTLGQ